MRPNSSTGTARSSPAEVDGAEEEKSLAVAAHGHLHYRLTPLPSGARFVHTHVMPMSDLSRGTYTGQFAFAYIEPKTNPGRYDQEIFLATHEWQPIFTTAEDEDADTGPPQPGKKDVTPTAGRSVTSVSPSMVSASAMASQCA